jgi:Uma2 family endonuclease
MDLRQSPSPPNHFVTTTDWDGYLKVLDALDGRHVKITYDRGVLELMSPSTRHEKAKTMLGSLVECWMEESGQDGQGGGSTTFRRRALDRGLEPDECYWIRSVITDGEDEVPAPDLAIEVEVTRSSLNRLGIYAALGVSEVWRWVAEGEGRLVVLLLTQPGVYEESSVSRLFPTLPLEKFADYVRLGLGTTQIHAVRQFRQWVRNHLAF